MPSALSAIVPRMKLNRSLALVIALLWPIACKPKQELPTGSASASARVPATSASLSVAESTPLEGEITLVMAGRFAGEGGAPNALTILVKDGKLRIDVPESLTATRGLGQAHLLALPADKKLYGIFDAKKQAVLIE